MSKQKYIDKFNSLIDNACDKNIGLEASRTYAYAAAQLYKKHKLGVYDTETIDTKNKENGVWVDTHAEYVDITNHEEWEDVQPFKLVINDHSRDRCPACKKPLIMGLPVAKSINTGEVVHFSCKRYFTDVK